MKAISFNFEIHQPKRLKRYRFFDIGNDHYYYDDFLNDDIISSLAQRSYIPAAQTLLRMLQNTEIPFKCSVAISGIAIEQFEQDVPEMIDLLKKMADTGKVEFLAQPYSHSLASLTDPEEFYLQTQKQMQKIQELFGQTPKIMRNTEFIYFDDLAPQLVAMGFKGVLTEGAKHILGWKSPDYVYKAISAPTLKLLMRNAKLSDDICFRFSDTSWNEYPLTAEKYISWIAATPADEQIINLCMNLDTFGGLQPASSGIFQFLEALPRFAAQNQIEFYTPVEAVEKLRAVDAISVVHPISGADEARDTSAWLGNQLQNEAFEKLYSVAERVRLCDDRRLQQDWAYLQASDHLYYMSTKHLADGNVHSLFSPYETPFQAFTNYMNVLADFIVRVEEQYPLDIDNEELNSLLTTIRNQATEIEALNKEVTSMRKNIEHFNEEHALRQPESTATPAPAKKTAAKKTAPKKSTLKETPAKKAPAPKAKKEAKAKKPATDK